MERQNHRGIAISGPLKRYINNWVRFFYPPLCIICSEPHDPAQEWLCPSCREKLAANLRQRDPCPRCSQNRASVRCTCTTAWPYHYSQIFAPFDFDPLMQKLVHQIKYYGMKGLATYIMYHYAATIPADFFDEASAIVPVPLHLFRRFDRGYNQAEAISRGLVRALAPRQLPVFPKALRRRKNTRTQTKLNFLQRHRNLADAFGCTRRWRETLRDKNIILVDDVVTTSATVEICSKLLVEAGVRSVKVLALARA